MAYTAADLTALKTAIARGVLSVEQGDEKVTYRSVDEMLRIQRQMESELGTAARRRVQLGYPTLGRGL